MYIIHMFVFDSQVKHHWCTVSFSPQLKKWYGVGTSVDYRLSQTNAIEQGAAEILVRKS